MIQVYTTCVYQYFCFFRGYKKQKPEIKSSPRVYLKVEYFHVKLSYTQLDDSYCGFVFSIATRPLLRQIDNLQSVHNAQTINWERVEESLSEKLGKEYLYMLYLVSGVYELLLVKKHPLQQHVPIVPSFLLNCCCCFLVSLQSQLNMAVAREHAALEKEHVIQSKQTGLETQLTNTKQAKAQLLATLEMEKARAEAVQEELER